MLQCAQVNGRSRGAIHLSFCGSGHRRTFDNTRPDYAICDHCPLNRAVELTLAQHERRLNQHDTEIKELLAIGAQFKLLMSLSIGGGGLSVITLILFITNSLTGQ